MKLSALILFLSLLTSAAADFVANSMVITNLRVTNLFLNYPANPPIPPDCDSINDASLKAYWFLDEASGNAIDAKGSNDLTETNSVGANTGKIAGCREFSSALGNYFYVADNADLSGGSTFTLSAWALPTGAGSIPTLMAKFPAAGNYEYILFYNVADSRYEFWVSADGNGGGSFAKAISSTTIGSGWAFVVAWYDSVEGTVNIQVNSGTVDSAAASGSFNGTGRFELGRNEEGNNVWNGFIDEATVSRRVYTAQEISNLYKSGLACRPTTLP